MRRLLIGYLSAVGPFVAAGDVPPLAARHIGELAAAAIEEAFGRSARPGVATTATARAARHAQLREAMRRRFAEPSLSMACLAREIGISTRSAYHLFAAAGESFSDSLYALRLERAAEKIRSGYAGRLIDLAFDVGFSDGSHFNRRFRDAFGQTPSAMRKQVPTSGAPGEQNRCRQPSPAEAGAHGAAGSADD